MMISIQNVYKTYNQGLTNEVAALRDINLDVQRNEVICLKGPSGSGKSTLLSIIGCVFPPTSGAAQVAGKKLSRLPDRFLTIHRREYIGFIFQQFNLLPQLTVLDNVMLPLMVLGYPPEVRCEKAVVLLERLGVEHRRHFVVSQISGGELQRVAIARALINDPPIILADEPTAHLDQKLSERFLSFMEEFKQEGKTIVMTSHDPLVVEHPCVDRVVEMMDGRTRSSCS